MMDIKEQFNLIAKTYDSNRKRFIPCCDDFYGDITKLIAINIESPKKILDLGAGTGILSSFWYPHFPKAEYTLVDIAEDMLDVARKRFAGLHNISYRVRPPYKYLDQHLLGKPGDPERSFTRGY